RPVAGGATGSGAVRLVAGRGPGGGPGTGEGQGGGRHPARAAGPAGGPDGAVAARATRRRPARLVRSVRPVPRVSPGRGRGQRQRERPGTAAATRRPDVRRGERVVGPVVLGLAVPAVPGRLGRRAGPGAGADGGGPPLVLRGQVGEAPDALEGVGRRGRARGGAPRPPGPRGERGVGHGLEERGGEHPGRGPAG